eukprot:scaffold26070_cov71-Cyclotella_meneghiniana.AAC.13
MRQGHQNKKRANVGLEKLGVSEDDVHLAERLLKQIPPNPTDPNKAERILGYATSRLERHKAVRLLGASEQEIEVENAKNLGSLGAGARRRSFSIIETSPSSKAHKRQSYVNRYRHTSLDSAMWRQHKRKHSAEIRRLRHQSMISSNEIEALKARINELENIMQRSASLESKTSSCISSRNSISQIVEE